MANKTMHHAVIGADTFELIDEAGREETSQLKNAINNYYIPTEERLDAYTPVAMYISSASKWMSGGSSIFVERKKAMSIKITPATGVSAYIALLTSNATGSGTVTTFAGTYTGRIVLSEETEVMLPSDCKYIYIQLKTTSNIDITPSSVKLTLPIVDDFDLLNKEFDFVGFNDIPKGSLSIGKSINSSGVEATSQYSAVTDYLENNIVYIRTGANADANSKMLSTMIHEYNSSKVWLRRTSITNDLSKEVITGDDCKYVRIVFGRLSSDSISLTKSDINAYFGVETLEPLRELSKRINALENEVVEKGRKNVAQRMKLLTDIEWTPIAPVPKQYRDSDNIVRYGQFEANEKVKGIPYGNQLVFERWAGKAVSFETFLSAVANPHSVIYSFDRFNPSAYYRPGAWYSTVCSKAVSFALNIKQNYASGNFSNAENVVKVADAGDYTAKDIRIGDILEAIGVHTALVTDIIYNEFGDIAQIEVGEAVTPSCRRKRWNVSGYVDNFFDHFNDYILYRYTLISDVLPVSDNYLDKHISNTVIMSYGNNANYYNGDTVKATLISKPSNTLIVLKDGESFDTIDVESASVGDEIPIVVNSAGFYSVNFDGADDADIANFIYNDCTASYNSGTGKITFSSSTAEMCQVAFCTGAYRSNITGKDVFPTDADISSGEIAVSLPSNTDYIHVFFKNIYGLVVVEIQV